jgi:molecular chaperone HtpG
VNRAFQVDLRGIVDLLSQHLYSGPEVYIRELLQNAVDASTAAGVSDPIVVSAVRSPAGEVVVEVRDAGIGLTVEEVHEFLSTIGSSSKRPEMFELPTDFLGRFGIGLLSCFLVADEIVVVTSSRRGGPGLRWSGRSDGSYTLIELGPEDAPPVGTTVRLTARPGMEEVTHPRRVLRLVERYSGLLGHRVLVRVEHEEHVVGGEPLPWLLAGDDREALLGLGRNLLDEDFLDAVPLSLPAAGLSGVAYVLRASPSPQSRQRHTVYLKRMLLSADVDRLAPDWAFFVRVVLNTDSLRPLASREGLYEDETLAIVREAIGAALRDWLLTLADSDPERLQSVIRVHALALKALAVHDDDLLTLFARWMPVETSMGRMTLSEAAARSSLLRYAEDLDTFRQLTQVAAAQSVLLVNGGYTYDADLLARLPLVMPGVETRIVQAADLLTHLSLVSGEHAARAAVLEARGARALQQLGCEVTVREFAPRTLPCLYLAGDAARFQRSAAEVAHLAGGFWGGLVAGLAAGEQQDRPQLCLNFSHRLIPTLVERDEAGFQTALEVLYLQALLLGRHPLRGREVMMLSSSLLNLLEAAR